MVRDRNYINLPLDQRFYASRDTMLWWRFTRKEPMIYAGVSLPGLFQTVHFVRDTLSFLVLLALEGWGLWNFLIAGQIQIIFTVFLFLLDLVFAIGRHWPVGSILELKNRLVYESDFVTKERHLQKIKVRTFVSHIFSVLIFSLAAFKVVSFHEIQGEVTGLTLGVMVSYVIVAILHVFVTGYFLAALAADFSQWLDRRSFVKKGDDSPLRITDHVQSEIQSNVELADYQFGRHKLTRKGSGSQVYIFETWGVLTDRDLAAFIGEQPNDEATATVAREGVRHQMEKILTLAASR